MYIINDKEEYLNWIVVKMLFMLWYWFVKVFFKLFFKLFSCVEILLQSLIGIFKKVYFVVYVIKMLGKFVIR